MSEDKDLKDKAEDVLKKGGEQVEKVKETAKGITGKITNALDADKDGDVDFDDFKLMANKTIKKGESIIKNFKKDK